MRFAMILFLSGMLQATFAVAASNVVITDSKNQTLSSEKTIRRYSLAQLDRQVNCQYQYDPPAAGKSCYFGLSDEGLYSRKTWDTYVYGAQGSLIAKKLLAFGSPSDRLYVRNAILSAPVQQSNGFGGIVDSGADSLGHLGEKYAIESNLELIIMARDYVLHSGDTSPFHSPIARVLCYRSSSSGRLVSVHRIYWEDFDCLKAPNQNQSVAFTERTHAGFTHPSTSLINPARALGQLFVTYENFTALRFGMERENFEPVRIIVRDNTRAITAFDRQVHCLTTSDPDASIRCPDQNDGWLEITFNTTLPAGNYNVEIHPVAGANPAESYWHSLGWWTEVDRGTHGGATTKLYPQEDSFSSGAKAWTMAEKIEFAMNWALQQSVRNGRLGIFISPGVLNRGTTEYGSRSSTYYDNFKSGYKDSYVNMLYLKALIAYDELVKAGIVRPQFTSADISAAAQDITAQLTAHTGGNGALMSWIDALGNDRWLGLLVPHALAATLPMPQPENIRSVYDTLRDQSRIKPGFFRTNFVAIEDVSPFLWDAHRGWNSFTTVNNIYGFASYVPSQTGDWHIFRNGIGNGNFGLQENNGGALLSTTAYTFAAGPYPKMFQDYRALVTALDRIGDAVETSTFNAYTDPDARKHIDEPQIFTFCSNSRPSYGQNPDTQNALFCGFYKDISFNLPENGVFPVSFAEGLLQLKIATDGSVTFYGEPLTSISRTVQVTSRFPPEITAVQITGYNISGSSRNISCTRSGAQLSCQIAP